MLISKTAKIKWCYKNKKRYTQLGYIFTNFGDEFDVNIEHLQSGSHAIVLKKCDYCDNISKISYKDYLYHHDKDLGDCCKNCENIKYKQTCLEKYGVENINILNEKKIKSKQTCLKKYGVSHAMKLQETIEKANNTNIKKYGSERPLQNKEILNKQRNTCIEKYGTEFPIQLEEFKSQAIENSRKTLCKKGQIITSKPQIKLFNISKEIFGKENVLLNYSLGKYSLDIFIKYNDIKIDLEYDGCYWHQDENKEKIRNNYVLNNDYRIIRIKGNNRDNNLPTKEKLLEIIENSKKTKLQIIQL